MNEWFTDIIFWSPRPDFAVHCYGDKGNKLLSLLDTYCDAFFPEQGNKNCETEKGKTIKEILF